MRKGFTLIEIMVVVSILIIMVSFAIPNILRARSVASEGAALLNLRTLADACQVYHTNAGSYPSALSELIEPTSTPPYIDSKLASGHKQGYQFIYTHTELGFTINANPESILGSKYYYTDETGAVYVNPDRQAGPGDELVT